MNDIGREGCGIGVSGLERDEKPTDDEAAEGDSGGVERRDAGGPSAVIGAVDLGEGGTEVPGAHQVQGLVEGNRVRAFDWGGAGEPVRSVSLVVERIFRETGAY